MRSDICLDQGVFANNVGIALNESETTDRSAEPSTPKRVDHAAAAEKHTARIEFHYRNTSLSRWRLQHGRHHALPNQRQQATSVNDKLRKSPNHVASDLVLSPACDLIQQCAVLHNNFRN